MGTKNPLSKSEWIELIAGLTKLSGWRQWNFRRPLFPSALTPTWHNYCTVVILRAFKDQPAKNRLDIKLQSYFLKGMIYCLNYNWQRIPYLPLTLIETHYHQGICLGHSFKKQKLHVIWKTLLTLSNFSLFSIWLGSLYCFSQWNWFFFHPMKFQRNYSNQIEEEIESGEKL